ncbi:MAG: hypothetical protein RR582_09630, partial [Niameybacter sp.]
MSDSQKDTAIKIGAMITVLPVMILLFGKMVKGVGMAVGMYGKFAKSVKATGSVFKVIFSPANKIVMIMTAIALVAGLVIKYWEPIKGYFFDLVNKIRSYLEACGVDFNKLKDTFNKVVEIIGVGIQSLIGFFMMLWEMIKPIIQLLAQHIYLFCSSAIGTFQGLMTGIGDIINGLMNLFGGLIDFIVGVFTGNWERSWQGGTAMIHDRGAEIVDLPRGSRVYPHDESMKKAFNDGAKSGTGFTIAKLADTIVVREDTDIDRIAQALYNKFKKQALNMA